MTLDAPSILCKTCGVEFTLSPDIERKYPHWKPAQCPRCYRAQKGGSVASKASPACTPVAALSTPVPLKSSSLFLDRESFDLGPAVQAALANVLNTYHTGPTDGIFTDGACSGNPGPGGWGCVRVMNDTFIGECHGFDPQTTNNRMELTALVNAYRLISPDDVVTLWSDSELAVKTMNLWAPSWEKQGWKRKTGPIKNLDLVQELFVLVRRHPRVKIQWLHGHNGSRWNEYADVLATAHRYRNTD